MIEAADGSLQSTECGLCEGRCDWEPLCPLHDTRARGRDALVAELASTSFAELPKSGGGARGGLAPTCEWPAAQTPGPARWAASAIRSPVVKPCQQMQIRRRRSVRRDARRQRLAPVVVELARCAMLTTAACDGASDERACCVLS